MESMELENKQLRAELEAARKDAERYRYLRGQCKRRGGLTICKVGEWDLQPWCGDDPDRAIDEQLAEIDSAIAARAGDV
jgi:hypothetical protein